VHQYDRHDVLAVHFLTRYAPSYTLYLSPGAKPREVGDWAPPAEAL
jgi:hypothetical protein